MGAVYTYVRSGSTWSKVGSTMYPVPISSIYTPTIDNFFGESVAMSKDGNVLAVGIPGFEFISGVSNIGAVFIYDWNSGTSSWNFRNIVSAETPISNSEFGKSVSLNNDGSKLFVGAESINSDAGVIYEFTFTSTWVQSASNITPLDIEANDRFGHTCSVTGDGLKLVIGSPRWDVGSTQTENGAVYSYILM